MATSSMLAKIIAVLWVIWGLVHVLAGVIVLSSETTGKIGAIADAVAAETLVLDYPAALGAILNQHGYNLGWGGIVTLVCGVLIWRGSQLALYLAAIVGGLLDIGYFLFLDLGGFVHFMPGTVMTIVSGSAILLTLVLAKIDPAVLRAVSKDPET
ncbi:MAG: hypothetical protein AAF675_07700 [Pseudomonadota bacterium]